jgi:NAD(P)H dehydrogenase (quinone)
MSKVLVLYYSAYGHIEAMANAVAEGARQAGAHVDIKRVPELVPEEVARKSHYKVDQVAPIAKVDDLTAYDAIIIGAGTRFGRMPSQMGNFLDQAGGLWARGALHGKVGGAFTSSATQHGGQETTLFSIITNLLHFGMVVVPDDARLWSTVRRDVGPGRRQGYVAGHSSGRGRLSCRPSEPIGGPQDPVRAAAGSPMRSTMAAPIGACAGSAWCYQSCTSSSVSGRPATSQASRPPQYQ